MVQNVIVSPSSQYYVGKTEQQSIRICFSNVKQREMEEGMKKIACAIDKILQNAP